MASEVSTPTLHVIAADGATSEELDSLQGMWTSEQYLRLTEGSNWLLEFTDGKLEVLPMPTTRHQAISKFLLFMLSAFLDPRGGAVYYSPLRLRIREGKFREPDLMVVVDKDDPRVQDAYWLGADMVMEIVSPDDPERDTIIKRNDYAEARIPEYWIVNPLDETITVLRLEENGYAEHGVFGRGDMAASVLLNSFSVDAAAVFDMR